MIYTKTAPEGKYLTQTVAVKDDERIFAKAVSGASDMLELDWRIATDKEVAAWQARRQAEDEAAAAERAEMERIMEAEEAERQVREEKRRKEQEERDAQIFAEQEAEQQ